MTQIVEGSVDTDPVENEINLIAGALDRLNNHFADRSPLEKLRVYKSIGHIAGGLLELHELVDPTSVDDQTEPDRPIGNLDEEFAELVSQQQVVEPEITPVSVEPAPSFTPNEFKPFEVADPETILDTTIVPETPETVEPSTEDVKFNEELEVSIRAHFASLKLTDREVQFMIQLCRKTGEKTRASDLYANLEGSPSALKQAATKFIRALKESEYGSYLTVTGNTSSTRYVWEGHGFSLDEQTPIPVQESPEDVIETDNDFSFAPEESAEILDLSEDQDVIIERDDQSSEVDISGLLKEIGIDLHDGEVRYLSIKGVPLQLTHFSEEVLLTIAKSKGVTTFRDLVNNEALKAIGTQNMAKNLNEALLQIATALKHHDIRWHDATAHIDGVKKRKIELGGVVPLPNTVSERAAFLAPGR